MTVQERGLDTVDANRALGLPDDCREYTSIRNIIAELGIKSVKLIVGTLKGMGGVRGGRLQRVLHGNAWVCMSVVCISGEEHTWWDRV